MGKIITQETHAEILMMREEGKTLKEIAEVLDISYSSVCRAVKEEKRRRACEAEPKDPSAPPRDCIAAFTPMYKRILELNAEKKRINDELRNITATLRNALEIAEGSHDN